jgi:prevent-host-death family protein
LHGRSSADEFLRGVAVTRLNIQEASTHLSRLIERATEGEEVIITKQGQPVARIVPYVQDMAPRPFGGMRGLIGIADDFDDPLPDDILSSFNG